MPPGAAPDRPMKKWASAVIATAAVLAAALSFNTARFGRMLRTTIAPTMLEGSIKENVLPMRARRG
jgi:hypothetical protein